MQLSQLNEIENPISRFEADKNQPARSSRHLVDQRRFCHTIFLQELHQVAHKLGRRLVELTKEQWPNFNWNKISTCKGCIIVHFIQIKYAILSEYFI